MVVRKEKKPEPVMQWFAEPDPKGNQWIAAELSKDNDLELGRFVCNDKVSRNFYCLRNYDDVNTINEAAKKFGWKVDFWRRKGNNGSISQFTYVNKKTTSKKIKKIDLKLVKVK
ncbi:MAG: hypothetical protein ACOYMB_04260 [Patescibacteria group bacterium]